jgi:hypothetical protein
VLQAMAELPMRYVFSLWRNGIEERRERARRFKQASAQGVRQWKIEWKLKVCHSCPCKRAVCASWLVCTHGSMASSLVRPSVHQQ